MTGAVPADDGIYLDLSARDDAGQRPFRARIGQTLLKALRDGGFSIGSVCGGGMSCATCHVHIAPGSYSLERPRSAGETEMLEDSRHYDDSTSRLACQVRIDASLLGHEVIVAEDD